MRVHQQLTQRIALDSGRRVAARVTKHLRSLRAQLSGEDSGLANVWEEFCVQVQGEESFHWDAYVETVKDAIRGAIITVRPLERTAMWLHTDAGADWLAENDSGDPPVAVDPDVVEWIYDRLRKLADDSRHSRVVAFLSRAAMSD